MKEPYSFDFGPFSLVPSEHLLLRDGKRVPLAAKAFAVLCILVENAGNLVTKDQLLATVWRDTFVELGRVDSIITEIRKALGGGKKDFIENVRRSGRNFEGGYRFVATVVPREQRVEPLPIRCPFPGLAPFDTQDSEYFFGREKDLNVVVDRLRESNFIALLGASGVGKSSLIRAGLTRELKNGAIEGSEGWFIHTFEPGPQPLRQLAIQITDGSSLDDYLADAVANQLRSDPEACLRLATEHLSRHPQADRILWVVDQFEELFTQCRDPLEQTKFISCLQTLTSAAGERNSVLITLRADYYLAVLNRREPEFHQLAQQVAANQVPIAPPDEEDLKQAMTKPAEVVGLNYELGLVDKILDDLRGQPGALPSLADTLRELFERREDDTLTFKGYQEAGGVTGSIAKRADFTYEQFSPDWKRITRRIMVRLCERAHVEDVLGRARQRITLNELAPNSKDRPAVEEVIRTLADARLLTISVDQRSGDTWVQLAHEALIQTWPQLRDWLWSDRSALRVHSRLLQTATVWRETRNEDLLYRRSTLAEAKSLLEEREDLFGGLERRFLNASQRLAQRENRAAVARRWAVRGSIIGFASAIVLACVVYFVIQQWRAAQRERDLATSLRLAAESAQQQQIDPELSLLLAMEAARIRPTKQAETVLRQAVVAPHVRIVFDPHTAQIISAIPSTDGRYLVTAGADQTARIWDTGSGELIKTLSGHTDWVNWAAFSTDGRYVVTASNDKTAIIWNSATGDILTTFRGHDTRINNAVFNREGTRIVTASGDKTARIWDVHSGKELLKLVGHTEWLNSAIFSPDGKLVVTASGDKTARVWNAESGKPIAVLAGHEASILNAAFSPDGKFVATASVDKTARVWDVASWKTVLELRGHTAAVNDAEFSPDGRWLATASRDGAVFVWNAQTGGQIFVLRGHRSYVNTASFSPDGRFVFSASGDGTAKEWVVRSPEDTLVLHGHTDTVYSATFNSDGQRIVTASKDATARVWDVASGKELLRLVHPKAVENAVFSPNGNLIATADEDGSGRIWNAYTGELIRELAGHKELVHAVSFNSDGSLLLTASKDKTARLWDAQTGECKKVLEGHTLDVTSAVFSKNGTQILTASRDNTIRLWDANTWQSFEWKVGTGFVNEAAFSADGRFVIAACADQTARVWDPKTHEIISVLRGHEQWINSADFSPDTSLVITASGDHTARIWDFASGQTLIQLTSYDNTVMGASFSPNGRLVATASTDHTAQIYKCPICGSTVSELLQLAQQRSRRSLTEDERDRFLKLR